jgi:hypothetical protein
VFICTADLADKKQVCQQIDWNFRFCFRHWTTSVAVFFYLSLSLSLSLCFQLAAGQGTLTTVLQPLLNAINSSTATLNTQATAVIQQIQTADNNALQTVTSQIQASTNTAQQYEDSINATSQQAQGCLTQQTANLTAIASATRK